ncbi:putative cytosol aminopeptidase [Desulfosarcina ovata subsp. sediminis]|uniref:Probable cytosol aminopeptidase n=1 Tax=Desulfosarcina ovata subsp. sediminis TaxID=885957 RepID=A0A5K7ZP45_9BACT|nr:leucyl aminopeptidase [Desulfosarcina ovata]BBO80570.1 putative cytosol aminopeptidase [Desulfosarcina ovata subsp. sediminis]
MLEIKTINLKRSSVDTLVVPVCEDQDVHTDPTVKSLVDAAKKLEEFSGKKGDTVTLFGPADSRIGRAVFFGLGKVDGLTAESFRAMAGKAVKRCIGSCLSAMTIATPAVSALSLDAETIFKALMEGACLGNHIFDRYKKENEKKPLKRVVLTGTAAQKKAYTDLAKKVAIVCDGAIMAREWVTTPSNDKRPEVFAETIKAVTEPAGLKVRVMDERWLEKQKFGAMLAVGQGSTAKPRLVTADYHPKGAKKTLVLVGKGVTFDSGGINLKPASGLETMKMDMSGAATVAGTMLAVARLKPEIRVVGVMPLVENMPSGAAIRPGDIVRSYTGKMIEIGNTDAEGRLILVDAMAWAIDQYQPDSLIDLATLTGACVIALGEKIAGVFSRDAQLAESILTSGAATHERCWQLPLPDDYKDLLKNEFADLNNMSSSRYGGAITAALFLSEFVGDTPWAHIDIAGPAWIKKGTDYCGAGGTGFGVRLLCDLIGKMTR